MISEKLLKWQTGPRRFVLLGVCYTLWALCYPPFNLGPLAFFLLAPILWVTRALTPKQAFWYNFFGGILYNLIMYYWIYNVMKVGPALVIGMGLVLLILFLSLFNAYAGWMYRTLRDKKWGWAIFVLFWSGFEVVRTKGQMSFPWSHLGYTLGEWLPLAQIASIVGVFGLSMLIVGSNVWIVNCIQSNNLKKLLAVPALILILLGFGVIRLNTIPSLKTSKKADIGLVQPSIEQTKKWDEAYFAQVMKQTYDVMDKADLQGAQLLILAETAVPAFIRRRPDVQEMLHNHAIRSGAELLVGSLDYNQTDIPGKPFTFFNSAFLFSPDTQSQVLQYDKVKLVPFSERLPFDNIFPVLNYVDLGEGDFSEGKGLKFWGKGYTFSPTICYEVVYPYFIRNVKKRGADFLVNITNDGWFGMSPAPFQHASIAKIRAIEAGLPIARCSNSGISVFYDGWGRTLAKTKLFEQRVLREKLPLKAPNTIYTKLGTLIEESLFVFWLFLNGWLFVGWMKNRRRAKVS